MRSLRAGQDDIRGAWRSGCGWQQAHLDTLEPHELQTSAPVFSAAPISRSRNGAEPTGSGCSSTLTKARLLGGAALPLALLAQRTGATTADAGSIHDAQAPVGFSALLMRKQRLFSRTPQRPIRLETKVLA